MSKIINAIDTRLILQFLVVSYIFHSFFLLQTYNDLLTLFPTRNLEVKVCLWHKAQVSSSSAKANKRRGLIHYETDGAAIFKLKWLLWGQISQFQVGTIFFQTPALDDFQSSFILRVQEKEEKKGVNN